MGFKTADGQLLEKKKVICFTYIYILYWQQCFLNW